MENEVKIIFKGEGDLLKQVKALDKATKSLINAQAKLVQQGKLVQSDSVKNTNAIKKLEIRLKALGSDFESAGVSNELMSKAMAGSKVELERLRITTRKHISDLNKQSSGILHNERITNSLREANRKLYTELKKNGAKSFKDLNISTNLLTQAFKGKAFAVRRVREEIRKLNSSNKVFNKGILDTQHGTRILGGSLAVLRSRLLLASFAMTSFSLTIGKILSLYGRQEKAEKKLAQALRSTSNAVNMSHKELTLMASGLQSVTTFGDEAIIEMQALLLTFTKIGGDVFPKATETILNIAEAMGQDLKTSAIQVGKALNEPAKGITALRRVGIQFSKEQEAQIKRFVSLNDVASAQSIILGELEVQFGGMARAVRGTVIGSFNALSNSFGDMMEKLGEKLSPFMQSLAESLQSVTFLMQTEGERQIAFLQSIGASEETLTKARIGLLKEEVKERLISVGVTDIDLNQRDELIGKYSQQDEKLNQLKQRLSEENTELANNADKLLDVAGSAEEYNKLLQRANKTTETAQVRSGKYGEIIANNVLKDKDGNNQLAIKIQKQQDSVKQTSDQVDKQQALTLALREYLIALGLLTEFETQAQQTTQTRIEQSLLGMQMLNSSFSATTGALRDEMKSREAMELDRLRNSEKFQQADSNKRKAMEKSVTDAFAGEKLKLFKMDKASSIANVIMNTASGVMKAYEQLGAFGVPVATMIGALGAVQLNAILATKPPVFETGGLVGGKSHSQGGTMIEAEKGEFVMSRNAVESIGIETLNQMNQGGTSGITLNISAPLVDDSIIDTIIPAINKAVQGDRATLISTANVRA